MPGQAGAATTLYTNTTRVGWIIAGSLAGVVAEIWSYHAVFWIALAMGVVTQACLWRIRRVSTLPGQSRAMQINDHDRVNAASSACRCFSHAQASVSSVL